MASFSCTILLICIWFPVWALITSDTPRCDITVRKYVRRSFRTSGSPQLFVYNLLNTRARRNIRSRGESRAPPTPAIEMEDIVGSPACLILASQSPNRLALLKMIGFDPKVIVSNFEENLPKTLAPADFVEQTALGKLHDVLHNLQDTEYDAIIAVDTVISVDGNIVGKPTDAQDAVETLKSLRGKSHSVFSGTAIAFKDGCIELFNTETKVHMGEYSDEMLSAYVSTGEPLNKAGSYGIQNRGAALVKGIEGCHYNVVGLPLQEIAKRLFHKGFLPFGHLDSQQMQQQRNQCTKEFNVYLANEDANISSIVHTMGMQSSIIDLRRRRQENFSKNDTETKFNDLMAILKEKKVPFHLAIAVNSSLFLEDEEIQRPSTLEELRQIIKKLRGQKYCVKTTSRFALSNGYTSTLHTSSYVHVADWLTEDLIEGYTSLLKSHSQPVHTVLLQGIGSVFCTGVEGSFYGALGLPAHEVIMEVFKHNLTPW